MPTGLSGGVTWKGVVVEKVPCPGAGPGEEPCSLLGAAVLDQEEKCVRCLGPVHEMCCPPGRTGAGGGGQVRAAWQGH